MSYQQPLGNTWIGVGKYVSDSNRTEADIALQKQWNPYYGMMYKGPKYNSGSVPNSGFLLEDNTDTESLAPAENYCGGCSSSSTSKPLRTMAYDDPDNNQSYRRNY